MKSFLFVNLIIVTARNHLSQHLAKAIQTNWNPPIGKNNMVKNTRTKQNNHKTREIIIFKTERIRKFKFSVDKHLVPEYSKQYCFLFSIFQGL